MDEDNEVHPLDALSAYSLAGSFVEARLARLKLEATPDAEAIEQCEGMSGVLFQELMIAASFTTDGVNLVMDEDAPGATRMLS